jgi:hypothetical protein
MFSARFQRKSCSSLASICQRQKNKRGLTSGLLLEDASLARAPSHSRTIQSGGGLAIGVRATHLTTRRGVSTLGILAVTRRRRWDSSLEIRTLTFRLSSLIRRAHSLFQHARAIYDFAFIRTQAQPSDGAKGHRRRVSLSEDLDAFAATYARPRWPSLIFSSLDLQVS